MTRRIVLSGWMAAMGVARAAVEAVNKGRRGMAVKGYDVVAYFTEKRAVKGLPQFMVEWGGATWFFASAAHRDQFEKEPGKYAPQFGGYCAWAVGHGYTADIDPEAWYVEGGKLYLNYNKGVQVRWLMEKAKWIAEGEKHWPGLHK